MPQLQTLSNEFAASFENIAFKGKDVAKQVENFIAKVLPRHFETVFGDLLGILERVGPIIAQLDTSLVALEQRQAALVANIAGARKSLVEALFTPAQLFETRSEELSALVGRFPGESPGSQAALVPQITALAQEVFQLAQQGNVFGDDREALERLQADLISVLDEIAPITEKNFADALAATREQRDILLSSFQVQETIAGLMSTAVAHLQTLTGLLAPIGSFQTDPGERRMVPATGLGLLHRGEVVSRPSSTSFDDSITVNVTVQGGDPAIAAAVGDRAGDAIVRKLQILTRYRQTRGI